MNLDTTRNRNAYQDIINAFASHECDILVGTQMITKGLHFDDVRLVAVLNADPLFNQPDFRAYERAYQMLEQVAGRAGRKGAKGEVWIQSFDPQNTVLQMVKAHDYLALYQHEIAERKIFNYPPFYRVIRLQMKDHNAVRVHKVASELQAYLAQIFGPRVSGVIIPSVERVQAYTLRELTLRIEQSANISEAKRRLQEAIDHVWSIPSNKNVKLIIDVDAL
jgi:primosomal protein N' (replication factor Y)